MNLISPTYTEFLGSAHKFFMEIYFILILIHFI